jgi:hypothetical protein
MPRPSELASLGRDDLRQAFVRFGGAQKICRMAGMVSFREWHYFEGQLKLLSELKRYLDEFADSDYTAFPSVSDIQRNGYEQLHTLIQYYGGRKFLAARLSMAGVPQVAGEDFIGDSLIWSLLFNCYALFAATNCTRIPRYTILLGHAFADQTPGEGIAGCVDGLPHSRLWWLRKCGSASTFRNL